jgi:hypothetical protein
MVVAGFALLDAHYTVERNKSLNGMGPHSPRDTGGLCYIRKRRE